VAVLNPPTNKETHVAKFLLYAKALVAAVFALGVTVYFAVQDKAISADEWTAIAAAWAGVVGVWAVPNKPADG
jgi:hypothetical protein